MRRKDREVTDIATIERIIAGSRFMHLGMMDGDWPYVVPLHYGYRISEGRIFFYIHCAREGHKLDCIRQDPNVFVEIDRGEELIEGETACSHGARFESVMCRGTAAIMEPGDEKNRALECLMKVQTGRDWKINDSMADTVEVIRVTADSVTCKIHE